MKISAYPAAGPLTTPMILLGNQGGATKTISTTRLLGYLQVTASGALAVGAKFGVRTSLGAFAMALPALAGLTQGDSLVVADEDNQAGINNITINDAGGDTIAWFGVNSSSLTLDLGGAAVVLSVNGTAWRAVPLVS